MSNIKVVIRPLVSQPPIKVMATVPGVTTLELEKVAGDLGNLATENKGNLVAAINEIDEVKVDKVPGKGLSTNDYSNEEKLKVTNVVDDLTQHKLDYDELDKNFSNALESIFKKQTNSATLPFKLPPTTAEMRLGITIKGETVVNSPEDIAFITFPKKVITTNEDKTKESFLYINDNIELKSLPNGVKDEIRPSNNGGYELVKRVSDWFVIKESDITSTRSLFTVPLGRLTTITDIVDGDDNINGAIIMPGYIEKGRNTFAQGSFTHSNFHVSANRKEIVIAVDEGVTLLADVKTFLQGKRLIYQLDTPIITPITTSGELISYPNGVISLHNLDDTEVVGAEVSSTFYSADGKLINAVIHLESSGLDKVTGVITKCTDPLFKDYETSRRTGKYLSVIPNSFLNIEFDKGNLYIFEYDYEFNYIKCTELISLSDFKLQDNTNYIKIHIENLLSTDTVIPSINYTSKDNLPLWVFNTNATNYAYNVNYNKISFAYDVYVNEGLNIEIDGSVEEQYSQNHYYDSGLLTLPPNYTQSGEPTKLIMYLHGSNGALFHTGTLGTNYEEYFKYLNDEGYAMLGIYGWTTKYGDIALADTHMGTPTSIASYIQAYNWVIKNYNISTEGVFIMGKSAGGMPGTVLPYNKGLPVKAVSLFSPTISPIAYGLAYGAGGRLCYADDFGFEGDNELMLGESGNLVFTEEVKEHIRLNASKIVGYNGYWNGIVNMSLETLVNFGVLKQDAVYENFKDAIRVSYAPIKIWVSAEEGGLLRMCENYITSVRNGNGVGEIRIMPTGTGGHNAVDSSPDALKVASIKTKLGITHTNVPLAYVETVAFFRRFGG